MKYNRDRDRLGVAIDEALLRTRPRDHIAFRMRADAETPTPPPPPPPADPYEEGRDEFAAVLRRALSGRKKRPGLGTQIAAALAAGGPLDPPATAVGPVVALNDDDTLKALALGAMTSKENDQ